MGSAASPRPARTHAGRHWFLSDSQLVNAADEPVAEPMHRAHEPRIVCRVAEGATDFGDQAGQIRVENVSGGPEALLQFGPRHRP